MAASADLWGSPVLHVAHVALATLAGVSVMFLHLSPVPFV